MARANDVGEPPRSAVRHGRLRKSSGWSNFGRVVLTAVLVVAFSGAATAAYAIWGLVRNTHMVDLGNTDPKAIGAGAQAIPGELNILLAGSDTRKGQDYNDGEESDLNDVTLLLHVSADHKNATVISFPRDLMVPIPSCPSEDGQENYYPAMSEQQLNSALDYGGLPCVVRTIEELTDMTIPYAGLITFNGVASISNALGGVDVCLAQPIVDEHTNLNLPAGPNTLVGWEALQFLRTRYGVGDGSDTSRINNQQIFMVALMQKLKSANTLSDPLKVFSLAKAGLENMTLSTSMASMKFMQAAAGTVKDIDLDHINFVQYPSVTHPYQAGRLRPDYASAKLLLDAVKSGKSIEVTDSGMVAEQQNSQGDGSTTGDTDTTTTSPTETPTTTDPGTTTTDPTTSADPNAPVKLPSNITGLNSSGSYCSAGRTVY